MSQVFISWENTKCNCFDRSYCDSGPLKRIAFPSLITYNIVRLTVFLLITTTELFHWNRIFPRFVVHIIYFWGLRFHKQKFFVLFVVSNNKSMIKSGNNLGNFKFNHHLNQLFNSPSLSDHDFFSINVFPKLDLGTRQ